MDHAEHGSSLERFDGLHDLRHGWHEARVYAATPQDLRRMLTLFVRQFQSPSGPSTIRLVLADRHPYSRSLWKSGFISRPAQGVFQVRSTKEGFDQPALHITSGDKDV